MKQKTKIDVKQYSEDVKLTASEYADYQAMKREKENKETKIAQKQLELFKMKTVAEYKNLHRQYVYISEQVVLGNYKLKDDAYKDGVRPLHLLLADLDLIELNLLKTKEGLLELGYADGDLDNLKKEALAEVFKPKTKEELP